MRRSLFAALTASLAISFAAETQEQHPNFSGVWKMDPARSESAHQEVPIGPVMLLIKHSPAEITIETRRKDRNTPAVSSETVTYRLDGTENTTKGKSGEPIKAWAHWDGPKLVTETARSVEGTSVTTNYVLSLDAGGRELTIDKTLTVQHGYQGQGARNTGRGKDVFIKAKGPVK